MEKTLSMNRFNLLILALVMACSAQQKSTITESDVIGTWKNQSLHITYVGRDSIFEVPTGQWEAVLKIKPIETTYQPDHTFISKYYALNDSLMFTNQGNWELKGDSLALTSEGVTTWYRFTIADGLGIFEGMLDWDQDGQANELYRGTQAKQ